jgi:DNA-binding response OmpR family regulator
MNNAIKFTEAGGSVKISSIRKEQIVSIIVSDTGVGMTESTRNKLFRIDQHITEKGTSGESGTGLGLIICKEFVDKHNGKVFAESEIGKGSRFIISIPNQSDVIIPEPIPSLPKQEDVLSEIIPAIKKDKEGILTNKTILIVEDNNNIRINIKNIFQGVCDVLENDNGKDGYDTAIDEIPDLIISDVLMPLMDGFEMCEKLKTDERTSHIPIIILTSKSSDQSKMHGLETGADDYITKPFNANLLFIRVVNLIKSRQELRKRFAREIKIEAREVTITSIDEKFLQKAIDIVEKNITDSVFDNEQFTLAMAMSRTQLYRKLKAVTGFSATEFIRTIRLKRAAQLLEKSTMRINEVAFSVGFSNPNYFYISFSEMFGMTPSEYAEKNKPC